MRYLALAILLALTCVRPVFGHFATRSAGGSARWKRPPAVCLVPPS